MEKDLKPRLMNPLYITGIITSLNCYRHLSRTDIDTRVGFFHQVIIITGLNKLYNCMFSFLKMALDADRA